MVQHSLNEPIKWVAIALVKGIHVPHGWYILVVFDKKKKRNEKSTLIGESIQQGFVLPTMSTIE